MIGTDIQEAKRLLEAGELVAIPTETVYGLAANAFNAQAVARIYEVKNRPSFNPLIIHTNSLERLQEWGLQLPSGMLALAKHFSPGPLTYVIPKSNHIPDMVTAGTSAVAVRIPNHPLTLALLASLPFPLAAPSANPSGYVSPTKAVHVEQQLGNQIPYVLDGGDCQVGVESTIISFLEHTPTLLRHGGVSLEQVQSILGYVLDKPGEAGDEIVTDNPVAPGQLARHYATRHKLIHDNPNNHLAHFAAERVGILSFTNNYSNIPPSQQLVLSPKGDLAEAAQQLFSAMRQLDAMDIDVILAEVFPQQGIGRAINDRLKRASVK